MEDLKNRNLILINGNVFTLDPDHPRVRWVFIHDSKIHAVGEGNEWRSFRSGKDEIIDCKGNTILPGFIDAHLHLRSYAEKMVTLDLGEDNGICSIMEIQNRISMLSRSIPRGQWLRGKGYNEFSLQEKRHLNRWDLDKVAPDHPVKITHRSSHAHVLNSQALRLVGISGETPEPPGGMIDRDLDTGEPTGLLYEMADYLSNHIPHLDPEELDKGIILANNELISKGITSVQDASVYNDIRQWELIESWKESSVLKPRVSFLLGSNAYNEYRTGHFETELHGNQLRVGGVKIILDETTGSLLPAREELDKTVSDVHNSGLQVAIHAIEESAIDAACESVKRILKNLPRREHRHRIEHCSVCPPNLARQIFINKMTVVTNPEFIYHSGERYLETVPDKDLRYLYAINTLLESGVTVAAGSDCPVVPPDPIIGIYAAISRMSKKGNAVNSDESISLYEALKLYTINAAKSSFEETIKGSITPGKLADLIILNGDISRLQIDGLKGLRVEKTILDGDIVWSGAV